MRIKKKNQNEYLLTDANLWIRNPYLTAFPIDANNLGSEEDHKLFLKNEEYNKKLSFPKIDSETPLCKNIVIVSAGYDFENKQKILAKLPFKKVTIIGVNRSLANWEMIRGDIKRAMNYYVINNPYKEAAKYIPTEHRYFPNCITSIRTNPIFTQNYSGNKYFYCPTSDTQYSGSSKDWQYTIDDYRNPICAAIGLAIRFYVEKLLIFCCDDSFDAERPASVKLDNNLWCYPQQIMSHNIIDANLYWLKRYGVKLACNSSGPKFKHAEYIEEEKIEEFFKDQDE